MRCRKSAARRDLSKSVRLSISRPRERSEAMRRWQTVTALIAWPLRSSQRRRLEQRKNERLSAKPVERSGILDQDLMTDFGSGSPLREEVEESAVIGHGALDIGVRPVRAPNAAFG